MTPPNPTLLAIISHARAGALERAWEMFAASGLEEAAPDVRVLSVKGRLLKDRARRASGEEQRAGYAAAASAYAQAADLDGSTYPLINAATLALLAGDKQGAEARAREVLRRIEANPQEPETPFYKIATGAEAWLLLGETDKALAQLGEAIATAPRAWEDHASTLRQFELVLAEQGADGAGLDPFRPPLAMHYTGHIALGEDETSLRARVDTVLAQARIGFAYGALAAGADIVIAEAVRDAGGELNVVLPCGVESFIARSVRPFGEYWVPRFEALLGSADTLRIMRPVSRAPDSLAITLSDRVAMGLAIMDAGQLATCAAQMLVLSEAAAKADSPGASARSGRQWEQRGLVQHRLSVERGQSPLPQAHQPDLPTQLICCLTVNAPASCNDADSRANAIATAKDALSAYAQPIPAHWQDDRALFALAHLHEAIVAGLALAEKGYGVAADMVLVDPVRDPLHGGERLDRGQCEIVIGAASTLLDAGLHASEAFAAAAMAEPGQAITCQNLCEIDLRGSGDAVPIFALFRA